MRIHKIAFEAIGPYPGRHEIDVDALGESGLFLLEGPTGSGKSTVIDAVTFALYGQLAGKEAELSRMHSSHAEPGVQPWVELWFEVPAGHYRVRRTPKFERPKQRGTGTTTQNASAKLWRRASHDDWEGELVSSQISEVSALTTELVGLSRDQFTQTVVLPQGAFSRFLGAGVAERKEILEVIFDTGVYTRVENELRERSKGAVREAEHARTVMGSAVKGLAERLHPLLVDAARADAAGSVDGGGTDAESAQGDSAETDGDAPAAAAVTDPPVIHVDDLKAELEAAAESGADALAERCDAGVSVARAATAQADTDMARAKDVAEKARQHAVAQQDLKQRQQERAEALQKQETLEAKRPEVERAAEALERSDRAAPVVAALRQADQRFAQWRKAAVEVCMAAQEPVGTEAKGFLEPWMTSPGAASEASSLPASIEECGGLAGVASSEADVPHPLPEAQAIRLAQVQDEAWSRHGELAGAAELEPQLASRTTQIAAIGQKIEALEQQVADDEALLEQTLPQRENDAVENLEAVTALAQSKGARQLEHEAAQKAAQAWQKVQAGQRDLQRLAAEENRAEKALDAAQTRERTLRAHWVSGLAGQLATELQEGQPCPVCGATQHPAPAGVGDDDVTRDDVERAEAATEEARTTHGAAKSEVGKAAARLEEVRAALGEADGESIEHAVAETSAALSEARAAEQGVPAAQAALEKCRQQARAVAQRVHKATQEVAALRAQRTADEEALARDDSQVTKARGDYDTVAARRADLEATARAIGALVTACRGHNDAHRELLEAAQAALAAVDEREFADAAEAREALMQTWQAEELRRHVQGHVSAMHAVTEQLASQRLRDITGEEPVDLEDAQQAAAEAGTASDAAVARHSTAAATLNELERAIEQTTREAEHLREVEGNNAALLRVARAVTGKGAAREGLDLSTYALLQRFDDVIAHANQRLRTIGGGRYELRRAEGREGTKREHKVGLGLDIIDHESADTVRSPATLSGGETFYVSLCLALGLSDAVTAEAGGVSLGTLFVDEGFGTLDAERLDDVMAVLGHLKAGGRTVGIVSHVAELKQRIAERIVVRRRPEGGSTLQVTIGDQVDTEALIT